MGQNEQRAYLARLAEKLRRREFVTTWGGGNERPFLIVANPDTPRLTERVLCHQAADGSWCYWWPWRQPIGAVDDLETVIGKIASVLRSVEGSA